MSNPYPWRDSALGAPVVMVTGIGTAAMAAATIALQWDLPRAVVVQHSVDVTEQELHRVVSDVGGTVDHTVIDLHDECAVCAIREDVVHALRQLTQDGRWNFVIAHLPIGVQASGVCRVLSSEDGARVRIAGVLAALDAATLVADLLGDDLLCERGLHTHAEDDRGVGEVGAAIIEYADHVALSGCASDGASSLAAALARPGVPAVDDFSALDAPAIMTSRRRHEEGEAWVAEVRRTPIRPPTRGSAWILDLYSSRPFHPGRLRESIESIGGGPRRSRGCFWLPSRPSEICSWEGAGGQLSVGPIGPWGLDRPITRITVTGITTDDGVDAIRAAFERCLLTESEMARRASDWDVATDGFEAWLGPICRSTHPGDEGNHIGTPTSRVERGRRGEPPTC